MSLDEPGRAAAFRADPDAALRGLDEPVLVDEWQAVPDSLGAIRRAVDAERRPGRFLVTGSVRAAIEQPVWPGTGRLPRVTMLPLTHREQLGRLGDGLIGRLASGRPPVPASDAHDVRDYVRLALAGGFPEPALRLDGPARAAWLRSYVSDVLSRDVQALESSPTRKRDPRRLERYFHAYALNSAGVPEHSTIYRAAGVDARTADAYESLLMDLFAVEQVPAWASNRLKRLVRAPKRYVIDTGLWGAALRVDERAVLADGHLLGRLLDTFATAQLRPEAHALGAGTFHLRTREGRREVDLLIELGDGRLVGFEVKAGTAPTDRDARHLAWLRDQYDERFAGGMVLHTGPSAYPLGDRLTAAPLSALWAS